LGFWRLLHLRRLPGKISRGFLYAVVIADPKGTQLQIAQKRLEAAPIDRICVVVTVGKKIITLKHAPKLTAETLQENGIKSRLKTTLSKIKEKYYVRFPIEEH